jgi:hypothetical protein
MARAEAGCTSKVRLADLLRDDVLFALERAGWHLRGDPGKEQRYRL